MVDFIRDDAEALMQYGSSGSNDDYYEAHQLWLEVDGDFISDTMTDDEIAEDCNRRQTEAEKFNQALAYFLVDWSGL